MWRHALLVFLLAGLAQAQPTAGRRPNGSAILPNGWPITPLGKQIPASTLPIAVELTPDAKYALVLNAGFLQPSISVIDLAAESEVQRLNLPYAWLGLALNKAGDKVFVGGGASAAVLELELANGRLKLVAEHKAVEGSPGENDFIGDVALSADEGLIYAANLFSDKVSVLNAKSGIYLEQFSVGSRPYRLLVDDEFLWISHWGASSVGLYNASEGRQIDRILTGPLPGDMLLVPGAVDTSEEEGLPIAARLFVACSNTNSVWTFGLTEGREPRELERIRVAASPAAPFGSAPSALAAGPDSQLLIAASGNNLVAIADISEARARPISAFPTGWYPTDVTALPDGRLLYLSGKGQGSVPAPNGPDPTRRDRSADYVAALQTGSVGITPALTPEIMVAATSRAAENIFYDDNFAIDAEVPETNPIPSNVGRSSPIEHVVYVLVENRTYSQFFGEAPVFGPEVAPNYHRLAQRFARADNFYAAGDVSADGQNWSTAAFANDFIEKLWPSYQAGRLKTYRFEGGDPAAIPPAGYLWSNAVSAGRSVRNYGMWTERRNDGSVRVLDPGLEPHTNLTYPPFDLETPDSQRVDIIVNELKGAPLPQLTLVRLPGSHTAGRSPGFLTPKAMMADHDYALGRLVEAISRGKEWPTTAILIASDDAQDGADPVDSHRSIALIVSPYAKQAYVDHAFYSTLSVLRTIELILGMRPMTQFDAAAPPMWRSFQPEPAVNPYEAVRPKTPLDEKNPPSPVGRPRRAD